MAKAPTVMILSRLFTDKLESQSTPVTCGLK